MNRRAFVGALLTGSAGAVVAALRGPPLICSRELEAWHLRRYVMLAMGIQVRAIQLAQVACADVPTPMGGLRKAKEVARITCDALEFSSQARRSQAV